MSKKIKIEHNQFFRPIFLSLFIIAILAITVITTTNLSQSQDIRNRAFGDTYSISPTPACNQELCLVLNATRHCEDQLPPSPPIQSWEPIEKIHAQTSICADYDSCYQQCQRGIGACVNKLVWSECSTTYGPTPTRTPTPYPTGQPRTGSCSPTCSTNFCGSGSVQQICSYDRHGARWASCGFICQIGTTRTCTISGNGEDKIGTQKCDNMVKKSFNEYCDIGYWGKCIESSPTL